MRRLLLVLSCAGLLSAHVAAAAAVTEDRGIVVRVAPPRIVIRELDGSRVRFSVNSATVITLNGRHVRLFRLRRGDVATIDHVRRLATTIQAVRP